MKKSVIAVILLVFILPLVSAGLVGTLDEDYCVKSELTDISPSSVEIGDEFTVGIHLENCGDLSPDNVIFAIVNPPTDISINEALIRPISKLEYSNSERFITYHMKMSSDAKPGTYDLTTKTSFKGGGLLFEEYDTITITVSGDEAELNIASSKTSPVLPYVNDNVELTMRIENFGEGRANSVKVYADHPFKGVKESFIGTLDSDEDGPAVFTFIADEAGEFAFPVTVSYKDDFGAHELKTDVNLTVIKKQTNWLLIISLLVALIAITIFIISYVKTKKKKDLIIQQLLKGEAKNIENGLKKKKKKTKKRG